MQKYYNTTIQVEITKNPELFKSPDWYKQYPVTKEQHDIWEQEAKQRFKTFFKLNEFALNRSWGITYLNASPYIKKD